MSDEQNDVSPATPGTFTTEQVMQVVASSLVLAKMMESVAFNVAGDHISPDHVCAAAFLLVAWAQQAEKDGSVTADADTVIRHHIDLAKRILHIIETSDVGPTVRAELARVVREREERIAREKDEVPEYIDTDTDSTKN